LIYQRRKIKMAYPVYARTHAHTRYPRS